MGGRCKLHIVNCIDCGVEKTVRTDHLSNRPRCRSCAEKAKPRKIQTIDGIKKRFLAKVIITENLDLCWIWKGGKNKRGYGNFKVNSYTEKAHRVSYRIANGDFDNSLKCLHKCDNPSCVNPNHLFLGTSLDNNRDRDIKGRNGSTKLSKEQVIEIRNKHSFGGVTNVDLSKEFNVSDGMICYIVNRKSWKHI